MIAGLFVFCYGRGMKRSLALALAFTLSACATVTGGRDQEISIRTNPVGAQCVLSNLEENWQVESTPASIRIPRAYVPIEVTCTLAGYAPAHVQLEPQTRGRAYGNIALFGVPALVDAGTGAGYEYSPAELLLTLEKSPNTHE